MAGFRRPCFAVLRVSPAISAHSGMAMLERFHFETALATARRRPPPKRKRSLPARVSAEMSVLQVLGMRILKIKML